MGVAHIERDRCIARAIASRVILRVVRSDRGARAAFRSPLPQTMRGAWEPTLCRRAGSRLLRVALAERETVHSRRIELGDPDRGGGGIDREALLARRAQAESRISRY